MSTRAIYTLRNFEMPHVLCCAHCLRMLPIHAECGISGNQVFVKCPHCEQMSSFFLLRGDGRRLA